MLTLAAAQILYAVAFQWVDVTGGDNGIVGVWPSAWASGRSRRITSHRSRSSLVAVLLLRRVIDAPFGYALRAARDSEARADAIGLDVAPASLARLHARRRRRRARGRSLRVLARLGRSEPPRHLDLGRCAHHAAARAASRPSRGPLVGAGVLHVLRDQIMPLTPLWRLVLGLSIIAMVLLFPRGLVRHAPATGEEAAGMTPSHRARTSHKSFGGVVGGAGRDVLGSSAARCWRSSARTAPASRRCSTWSAASSGPIAAGPARRAGHHGTASPRRASGAASGAPSRWRRPSSP